MNELVAERILVVDDDPTARILMQASLQQAGFAVQVAADAQEALQLFHGASFDLVMSDVEMPGMDGFELCARLRAESDVPVPVVMVTGMDDLASIDRAFEAGATDFLPKPINWSLLGHRVRYILRASAAMSELRRANASNRAILDAIPDLLFEMDLEGLYLEFHSAEPMPVGWTPERVVGRRVSDVLPGPAAAAVMGALRSAATTGRVHGVQYEIPVPKGSRWFELSAARKEGEPGQTPRFVVLARDITERKSAERQIEELAYVDTLTGLPNRLSFLQRLEREIVRAGFLGNRLAVLFLDMDGFKNINDTLGHTVGDLALQTIGTRLREGVRPTDVVSRLSNEEPELRLARLGGDEFTVLVPRVSSTEAVMQLAERIRDLMTRPFVLEGREVVLTTSIGIALYPEDGNSADALLKHADTAMYHAKEEGRDNCKFYNVSLTQRATQQLNLASNLRLALERGEFRLAYQPQLDVASGTIRSVEALIRWTHPEHGVISPMDFVPAAERSGLIVGIGEWVLRTACADAVRWRDAGHPLRVGVNLSARQLRNAGILDSLRELMGAGIAPELLELEVTESVLMEDSHATLTLLRELRATGVSLSLDDFGTGYSSMSYLRQLPIHRIKIDQSFVQGLPGDAESLVIVRAIVGLARSFGFGLTAEGVETLEQARLLRELGCDSMQGYYFSRPVSAEEIPGLLAQRWPQILEPAG
jgi:diguanylate cyclase (GGDEF)-like protein/PAS domain S-box-containing protein